MQNITCCADVESNQRRGAAMASVVPSGPASAARKGLFAGLRAAIINQTHSDDWDGEGREAVTWSHR